MKSMFAGLTVIAGFLVGVPASYAIQFDYASLQGTEIAFLGSGSTAAVGFTTDGNGDNFEITGVTGGTGTAVGYRGSFVGGSWVLGPVTTITLVPLLESAPIAGFGTITIHDSAAVDFTATLGWIDSLELTTSESSSTGVLNGGPTPNISNASYSGSDPDLLALLNGLDQTAFLNFIFEPSRPLAQLVSQGNNDATSFRGTVTAFTQEASVPETGTIGAVLLLGTAVGCRCWRRFRPDRDLS